MAQHRLIKRPKWRADTSVTTDDLCERERVSRLLQRVTARLHRKTDTGFTILEVTVAMFVFSLIVVGIVGMQAAALKGRASALEPAEPAANGQEALDVEPKSDMDALANELPAQEAHARDAEPQGDHWRREWQLLNESTTSARLLAERTEKERAALYLEARSDIDALANELRETQLREAKALAQAAAQEARARDAERERDYWRREWQLLHESATWKVARSMLQSAPAQVLYPLIERVGRYVRGKRPPRLHR